MKVPSILAALLLYCAAASSQAIIAPVALKKNATSIADVVAQTSLEPFTDIQRLEAAKRDILEMPDLFGISRTYGNSFIYQDKSLIYGDDPEHIYLIEYAFKKIVGTDSIIWKRSVISAVEFMPKHSVVIGIRYD